MQELHHIILQGMPTCNYGSWMVKTVKIKLFRCPKHLKIGRFAFSVHNKGKQKGFVWVWLERIQPKKARVPNPEVIAVRVSNLDEKDFLLAAEPGKFFTEPHYNGFPAILVRLADVEYEELSGLLINAWSCQAPATLVKQFKLDREKQGEEMKSLLSDEQAIRSLYQQMLACWNQQNADGFAALYARMVMIVGFDGSQMNGRAKSLSVLGNIFAHHQTATYISKVREVRLLSDTTALLRAVVGMIPPGQADINPAVNAIQTLVAVKKVDKWCIALFQRQPAQFHGKPEISQQLTEELRQLVMTQSQKIIPCLWFDSNAEEAANFYTSLFANSQIGRIMRYGNEGQEITGKPPGSVLTVDFQLAGFPFVALNGGPLFTINPAISFWVTCESEQNSTHCGQD